MKRRPILIFAAVAAAAFAGARKMVLTVMAATPLAFTAPAEAGEFDHSHAAFTAVLKATVADERVDYEAIKRQPEPLEAYLGALSAVNEAEFRGWPKAQELAYLINLYNAVTIKLVVENYPVKSIKKIGNLFKGPWDQEVVPLFGETVTLNHIEHQLIRPQYGEPRAHFALVCASVGCPPLRAEAFTADRLSAQMDEQARLFFATPSKNRVAAGEGVLYLSPIFEWFAEDFTAGSKSIEEFVAPYFGEDDRRAILGGKLKVKYTDYDWSLNKQ